VREGRFDPGSRRHRDLLDLDELAAGVNALTRCLDAYRMSASLSSRRNLATWFASLVEG
jgi:hypothetical protein